MFFPYTDSFEGSLSRMFTNYHSVSFTVVGMNLYVLGDYFQDPQLRNKSDRFVTENSLLLVNKNKGTNL